MINTKISDNEMDQNSSVTLEVKIDQNTTLVGDFYDSPSKKGIILLPGFTEYRSSLEDIAISLNKEFKTWIFDINSQGESTGKWNLSEMQRSFGYLSQHIMHKHCLSELGAYGNSIGGMAIGLTAAYEISDLRTMCLSSTPARLQDVVPEIMCALLKLVPQPLVRYSTILFDKIEKRNNLIYRKKTHAQFFNGKKYQKYAMFGAMKIQDVREIADGILIAPSLKKSAGRITIPTLFLYGGEDHFLGIRRGMLPKSISSLYDKINSKEKKLIIVDGADHSLNTFTKTDENFNYDSRYQFVKNEIFYHFMEYMQ